MYKHRLIYIFINVLACWIIKICTFHHVSDTRKERQRGPPSSNGQYVHRVVSTKHGTMRLPARSHASAACSVLVQVLVADNVISQCVVPSRQFQFVIFLFQYHSSSRSDTPSSTSICVRIKHDTEQSCSTLPLLYSLLRS